MNAVHGSGAWTGRNLILERPLDTENNTETFVTNLVVSLYSCVAA